MAIHHIVLLKFKPDITLTDAENVRARLRALPSQISSISGVQSGMKMKHDRDHDFDEGIIFVFKDEDALKNDYVPHKAHRDYQADTAPYIEDKLIFDIYVED